jgi:sugar (pentulose or hexulose) kinase
MAASPGRQASTPDGPGTGPAAPARRLMGSAWVGIDVGTQSVRAVVVDGDGDLLGSGSAPLRSARPQPGHHEQDPEDWWVALGRATRQALAGSPGTTGSGRAAAVCGVAICSTSGTVVLTDEAGRPQAAALMYDDTRAVAEAQRVAEAERVAGAERAAGAGRAAGAEPAAGAERVAGAERAGRAGRRVHPSSAVPRLLWLLAASERAARGPGGAGPSARGLRLAHCADLLAGRLVGHPVATDQSHALKSGFDPELLAWRRDLFDRLGVPAEVLPEVVPPGTLLGGVSRDSARHTGLVAGTPVLAGMTDGCAAQIASGALGPNSWNSVLGTTLAVKGVCAELVLDPPTGVYSHRHPDGQGWLVGGASNVGAGALTERFPGADLAALDAAAAHHEPASAVLYPLSRPGERFPFARPDALPIELGDLGDRADHFAAILQGVAFVERLCLERMRALGASLGGPLHLTGGGARSDYWCQLRADIHARPVRRPLHPEPSVGMAILAAAAGRSVTQAARRMVRSDLELEPRANRVGNFDDAYERLRNELIARGYLGAG